MTDSLVDVWRKINEGIADPWVLFGHGTVVIIEEPSDDPARLAAELMEEWGPVIPGTPAGDFDVIHLVETAGWLVTCHHPDIRTYVGPDDFAGSTPSEVVIGLTGRMKRDEDARELAIVHVEPAKD